MLENQAPARYGNHAEVSADVDLENDKYLGRFLYGSLDMASAENAWRRTERTERTAQNTASDVLPNCEINCDPTTSNPLGQQEALLVAQKLREALDRRGILGGPNPDVARVNDLLNGSSGHLDQISAVYKTLPGQPSLLDALHKLPIEDRLNSIAMLRSRDGRPSDAVNLMTALQFIPGNRDVAEQRVIETFRSLDPRSVEKFEKDFEDRNAITVTEALQEAGVSPEAMRAIDVLRKPVNERTAEDLKGLADFAVSKKNLELLTTALGGNSPQAQEARAALKENAEFISRVTDAFRGENSNAGTLAKLALYATPVGAAFLGMDILRSISASRNDPRLSKALDIVSHGASQLETAVRHNTGGRYGMSNENIQNITAAVNNATHEDKSNFSLGHSIAIFDREPSNAQERVALDFYRRTSEAFRLMGSARLQAQFEERLLRDRDFYARYHWNR